jgi:hypothetical protein
MNEIDRDLRELEDSLEIQYRQIADETAAKLKAEKDFLLKVYLMGCITGLFLAGLFLAGALVGLR